jgi:hypothetical protein
MIKTRHTPLIHHVIRQHDILPLPDRRRAHGDRVQPARILPINQHAIEQIGLADLRKCVSNEARPWKARGVLETAVGAHDV